jgi:SAM-dependent methyltransferase
MDLKESEILGDDAERHWYYRSKARALRRVVGDDAYRSVLDVGAGSGIFSTYLLRNTGIREAWCVDPGYTEDSDAVDKTGKPVHRRRSLAPCNADLVLLMDVLEHVDDDVGLLRECAQRVNDGATFIITVPAFQFLWSGHDDFLEHRRRYTLRELEAVVQRAGLTLKGSAYFFATVFPFAAAMRLAQKTLRPAAASRSQLRKHGSVVNSVLSLACWLELPVFQRNRLAGLTAFCTATKPA